MHRREPRVPHNQIKPRTSYEGRGGSSEDQVLGSSPESDTSAEKNRAREEMHLRHGR